MEALEYEILIHGLAKIIICKIPEAIDGSLGDDLLDEYYGEYLDKITSLKRKNEFVVSRLALNILLGQISKIAYQTDGKPYLLNFKGFISISHSQSYVALIYHPSSPVGIDIEFPSKKVLKVHDRFLNPIELSYFAQDIQKIQLAWSVKEAIYKMKDKRYVDFAQSMSINDFEIAKKGKISCESLIEPVSFELHYSVEPNYNLVYTIE